MASFRSNGPRLRSFDYLEAMSYASWGGAVVNAMLVPLFLVVGVWPLALLTGAGALAYAYCLALLRRKLLLPAVWLALGVVLVEVPGVVLTAGWESGFQYFLLAVAPLTFIGAPRTPRWGVFLASGLGLLFLTLDVLARPVDPWWPPHDWALPYLRVINIAGGLALCSYIAWRYGARMVQIERDLADAASTDPLTGLANRRRAVDIIRRELARCDRIGTTLSVVEVDIDRFKLVNDQYGHGVGDEVLVAVGNHLEGSVRTIDLVARWGGEEYLMLLPDTPAEQAMLVAERIRSSLAGHPVTVDGLEVRVTATFGVAEYRRGEAFELCVSRADQALYEGKRAGRNQVRADPGDLADGAERPDAAPGLARTASS